METIRTIILLFLMSCMMFISCDKSGICYSNDYYEKDLPNYSHDELLLVASSYIDSLTSEKFAGRKTGTSGIMHARNYLCRELISMEHNLLIAPFTICDTVKCSNIIVPFKGKSDKTIIVGAHYDGQYESVGRINYQNANDNASGTAALLTLAKILSNYPSCLDYSILLCFWDAEEFLNGAMLSGSTYFTDSTELNNVCFYLNIDGVGTDDGSMRVNLYSNSQSHFSYLDALLTQVYTPLDISLIFEDEARKNLDTYPFYKKGIPYVFWACPTEMHEFNHTPQDSADKISPSKIVSIAEYTYLIIKNFDDRKY